MMRQQFLKHVCVRFFFIFFLIAILLQGCRHRSESVLSSSSQNPDSSHAVTTSVIRYGAVHYTFADVYAEPEMDSERLTQCMYGDVVRIEEEFASWYAVKVGPYPELFGWIQKTLVTPLPAKASYITERNVTTIIIRQDQSEIFVWPSQTIPIAMGTELPFLGESGQWYLVRLPTNDIGRISRTAVQPIELFETPLIKPKQPKKTPQKEHTRPNTVAPIFLSQDTLKHRRDIIATAEQFLGKVYMWGGTTPRGFDCSGLTYFVYKLNGIELPRVSWLQYRNRFGKKIKKGRLTQGDLVFFQTYKPGPSHVGIYIGNNQFIHASPSYGVTIGNLDEPYFKKRYIGAKTVFVNS
ncbi:hypothetical protein CSA56_13225 [candidate division KSB3 bacterium]|uniref:NlpC/P60 domain-containing protein n=1 Tax=candidate division KSB3 bacterium TaxID=2044937 RepID=A0A2G6KBG7_9BACT|nr:MAG: hypothetical protein CSA56_13225 [candidate division KSB3 bacterium]